MKILMLGNSLTYYNDMPQLLAKLTGAQVTAHTRGGARLSEQLYPEEEIGRKTLAALEQESWDYVVLQEHTCVPLLSPKSFARAMAALCERARRAGAVPVLYATWAYRKDSPTLAEWGMDYEKMADGLSSAYQKAARQNHALVADVGARFHACADGNALYVEDGVHPSAEGSRLAAETLAEVIMADRRSRRFM